MPVNVMQGCTDTAPEDSALPHETLCLILLSICGTAVTTFTAQQLDLIKACASSIAASTH